MFRIVQSNSAGTDGSYSASVLQAGVTYDYSWGEKRLSLQWQPRVGFLNGHYQSDLNNERTGFDLSTLLSARLRAGISERFYYVRSSNLLTGEFLYVNPTSWTNPVQSSFLQAPGLWVDNDVTASLGYFLTERNELTFSSDFAYSHLSSTTPFGYESIGVSGSLRHALSATTTLEFTYYPNLVKFANSNSYAVYHNLSGSLTDKIRPSWFVSMSLGASRYDYGRPIAAWNYAGTANVQKRFHSSAVALAYTRGINLDQYSSPYLADRADLSYQISLTNRLLIGAGTGYQRVPLSSNARPISGEYGTGKVSYALSRSLSLQAAYSHLSQLSDALPVYAGIQNTVYVTLHWEPPLR